MRILGLFLKGLKIAMIGLGIFAVVYMILLATQTSATHGPLETYEVKLTTEELHNKLTSLEKEDSGWTFTMTDTIGPSDNQKFICNIRFKNNNVNKQFNIAYEALDGGTKINLVGAFDFANQVGGYKDDIIGIDELMLEFNDTIIKSLSSNTSR